jgi:hydrogenase maturation protease
MEQIIILGLGNILYGDEGFGVLLAQRLYAHWDFPENVEIVDGGTQGQTLLTFVERADRLLVLDAVDFGLEPGELLQRDNVPAYLTAQKIGPHQNSFSEVMGLAALRGTAPDQCTLIGVQPAAMTLAAPLSTPVSERFEAAQNMALNVLQQWGISPSLRAQPRHLSAAVLDTLAQSYV